MPPPGCDCGCRAAGSGRPDRRPDPSDTAKEVAMHPYQRWRALAFGIGLLAAVGTAVGLLWLLMVALLGAS